MTDSTAPVATEGRLRRISIAVSLGLFAVNLDFFAIQTALPSAAVDLGTTPTRLQWAVSGYLLSLACFLIVGGRLADIFGRKTFLLAGAVIFGVTSLLGGMAPTPWWLIAMRVLQGIGGALLFPVGLSVITNAYPPQRVGRAIGVVFGVSAVGTALGPLLGGAITQLLSWRFVLWLNVPMAAVVFVMTLRDVSQSRDPDAPRSIDWWGLLLVVLSVGSFTYGIDAAGRVGWGSPGSWVFVAAGILGFVVVVLVELRVRVPLLDLALFRIREFTVMVLAGAAANMTALATIFASMTFLQSVRDQSALVAGLAFLSFSIPYAAGNQLSGRLERFPSWAVMAVVLVIGGAGTVVMGLVDSLPLFFVAAAFSGLGLGVGWAYSSIVTQAVVPPGEAGLASGMVLTVLIGLGGVAIAVASTVIESRSGSAASMTGAIDATLIGFGILALAAAAVVALLGRRGAQRPAP
ncbi:MAG: MFS transporter [Candidatus Nanopelagicales bacterium]